MSCNLVDRHASTFLDGELDPQTQVEFERHVDECAPCQERLAFERSYRRQVRESLGRISAPAGLAARVSSSLDCLETELSTMGHSESRPAWERSFSSPPNRPLIRRVPVDARHALPLAAAAVAFLALGGVFAFAPFGGDEASMAASVTGVPIFEDVIRLHTNELPADVRDPEADAVTSYFRGKLDFPVHPAEFDREDVRLVGARLWDVPNGGAAILYYDVAGRRITVVVREAQVIPPGARTVRHGGAEVHYLTIHGHVVSIRRHGELEYVFAGDVEPQVLLRLAGSSRVRY